jgi:ABC-type nitrate/sulfonate/bicarbonate transport system substrate-binding protein
VGANGSIDISRGGSLSLHGLIGKSIVALAGSPPVVSVYLQGAKIKIVGGVKHVLPDTFVAVEGTSNPEQLKRKKIGISRLGSNTDYGIRLKRCHMSHA